MARARELKAIPTVTANLSADGRDGHLDYKCCGMDFPPASGATKVIEELVALAAGLVLPLRSSTPLRSTSHNHLLHNLGIRTLVVIGLLSEQCMVHTVKYNAYAGYQVAGLHDACHAETLSRTLAQTAERSALKNCNL